MLVSDLLGGGLPDLSGTPPLYVAWDSALMASDQAGDNAGCPYGYAVEYATPGFFTSLFTKQIYARRCILVSSASSQQIQQDTGMGIKDQITTGASNVIDALHLPQFTLATLVLAFMAIIGLALLFQRRP